MRHELKWMQMNRVCDVTQTGRDSEQMNREPVTWLSQVKTVSKWSESLWRDSDSSKQWANEERTCDVTQSGRDNEQMNRETVTWVRKRPHSL